MLTVTTSLFWGMLVQRIKITTSLLKLDLPDRLYVVLCIRCVDAVDHNITEYPATTEIEFNSDQAYIVIFN